MDMKIIPLTNRGRALVLVDGANLRGHLQSAAYPRIDGYAFAAWCQQFGRPTITWFQGAYPGTAGFFAHLRAAGIEVVTKAVKHLPGGARKADMDMEIGSAALRRAHHFSTVVLVTADGDFACIVRDLRAMGVDVVVVAPEGTTAHELIRAAGAENVLDLHAELPAFGYDPRAAA
ncbi:NYN domain-containing protein [Iamia sp. SCSIO 61187]|uniref:NYN domain-containing protein n=1 Tax=Iamia sp. SCSIO 61187 TaxID=2722752 RepID=UPI001C63A866|nr:NYN domain-containing protein [Iamia sp. SCSIO 61187]QYG91060.1 NYN domain-containing protein [Iamia sp. SCSIO 61187]